MPGNTISTDMWQYGICDMHGHFLPGMDDGSASVEESLQMLAASAKQGIGTVFATPHYYPVESVSSFLERREKSISQLQRAMEQKKGSYPRIIAGAEVAYRRGIGTAEDLEKLCLGNSRYLLLELPFARWEKSLFRDLSSIVNVRGLLPVIAHIERYRHLQPQENMDRLLEMDVLLQMNASELLSWSSRRRAARMIRDDVVQLLGSDCHNMHTRVPNMGQALAYLEKKGLGWTISRIAETGEEILRTAL